MFSPNGYPKRSGSSDVMQTSDSLLSQIDEELHDARRVQSYGQEEDLRAALGLVINRVVELSSLLNEAYKTQAELEVQLNVAKSNLQLVISNNEMLEDALKREANGHTQSVGWHRRSGRETSISTSTTSRTSEDGRRSLDLATAHENNSTSSVASPQIPPAPQTATPAVSSSQDSRFFRFRFTGSSSTTSKSATRPGTPTGTKGSSSSQIDANHLSSSSMPALPLTTTKEIEELSSELEKERTARKSISEQKAALEAELESLSQALFEEANNMVATERMRRAETEEELKEAREEREALRSALRVLEGENSHLRGGTQTAPPAILTPKDPDTTVSDLDSVLLTARTRLRSSSQIALKSPITSPRSNTSSIPLPAAEVESNLSQVALTISQDTGHISEIAGGNLSDDALVTPMGNSFKIHDLDGHTTHDTSRTLSHSYGEMESSPWDDVPPG